MKSSLFLGISALLVSLFISGCSSKTVQVQDSAFLKPNESFVETGSLEGTKTYIEPSVNFKAYENIYVAPIKVISAVDENELTDKQKLLKKQMSEYLTEHYKDLLRENASYTLVEDKNLDKTLVYEGSVSSVKVEFDELNGMSYMPMMFVGTMVARATFKDGNLRILGEGRLKDAKTNAVLIQMIRLEKGKEIDVDEEDLEFSDVKPTLDAWLKNSKNNLAKIRAGIVSAEKAKQL